ncbi:MAG: heparinase II/III family protein, partial [Armatimonadetes bacterium]|nr:heparinase II/III family protein [Armatimonadota bacterium]
MLRLPAVVLAGLLTATNAAPPGSHPVLNHRFESTDPKFWADRLDRVMTWSEAELLELIPTQAAIAICGCPNCGGGPSEWAPAIFNWSIASPRQLTCKFCGEVYPSAKYPDNQVATGLNALGESVSFRYHLNPKTGIDHWFEATADWHRREWMVRMAHQLGQAYHLTANPAYARRAALILLTSALAYPHMVVLDQWPGRPRRIVSPQSPYPATGGKWGRWLEDEVPSFLPEAYDLIAGSGALEQLSRERGIDARQAIADFFKATIAHRLTFGAEPTGRHLTNMYNGPAAIAQIGWTLGEPQYVHWAWRWCQNMLATGYTRDGMWQESASYHEQTTGGLRVVMEAFKGYSDPPGYRAPDGTRLDKVDAEADSPFMKAAMTAPWSVSHPDGSVHPAHDTWWMHHRRPARAFTRSAILPGWGHAALGRGEGDHQMQAHLHFSGGWGHEHYDTLNFGLWARGSELAADLGYTNTRLRGWTADTLSHNTVVVDKTRQLSHRTPGSLLRYVPDLAGVSSVAAAGEAAYPKLVSRCQRELTLIPLNESDAYVLDIFRVTGGSTHDWALHGSALQPMQATCSLPLTPRPGGSLLEPGEAWAEPADSYQHASPYGFVREVSEATTAAPLTVAFAQADNRGFRTHLPGGEPTTILLGKSPSVRLAAEDNRHVDQHWMPQLVLRRQGAAPLDSTFIAVHEPHGAEPFLTSVERLPLPGGEAVALRVRAGEVVDTIISSAAEPFARHQLNGVEFRGRLGIVREVAGVVTA